MNNQFIGIDIVGEEIVAAKLNRLPIEAQNEGVIEANKYIVNVMKAYQPYQHIWRSRAFTNLRFVTPGGKVKIGYASWRQFQYVHALAAEGKLPYRRTQKLARNWKTVGAGRSQIVVNETEYAGYVMGKKEQDRLHNKMGWKPMEDRVKERMSEIVRRFEAGVKRAIRKVGL